MGNGYNHQSIQHNHHKNIYLPLFCRLSIKDLNLSHLQTKPTPSKTEDPSSPKVTCMGKVKRSNRVISYPTTTTTAIAAVSAVKHHHKYSKLRKMFSGKSLLPPAPTTLTVSGAGAGAIAAGRKSVSRSCRTSNTDNGVKNIRRLRTRTQSQDCINMEINIDEIDPPLPVVKRMPSPGVGRDEINIWKRRGFKGLKIEQIQLPNCDLPQPPTTV